MGFGSAVKSCLSKYATFQGRACRSEYWFFTLFFIIVLTIANIIDATIGSVGIVSLMVSLALLLPSIAVVVRRLHDTDRSGWWYFLYFLPLIGVIVLLVWFCTKGTPGPSRFGEDPLGGEAAPAAIAG